MQLFEDENEPLSSYVEILSLADLPENPRANHHETMDRLLVKNDAIKLLNILKICHNIKSYACSSTPMVSCAIRYAPDDHEFPDVVEDLTPIWYPEDTLFNYNQPEKQSWNAVFKVKEQVPMLTTAPEVLELSLGTNREFVVLTAGLRPSPGVAEYSIESWNYPPNPRLKRISLFAARSMPMPIVWGRKNDDTLVIPTISTKLTHFDLFGTGIHDIFITVINEQTERGSVVALNIGMCPLSPPCLLDIFVENPHGFIDLKQLNLWTTAHPSRKTTLARVIRTFFDKSPIFRTGQLEWLDISGADVTPQDLSLLQNQPRLKSLGLSFCPKLDLNSLVDTIRLKMPNLEILTLVDSCRGELDDEAKAFSNLLKKLIDRLQPVAPWEPDLPCGVSESYRSKLRVVEINNSAVFSESGSWTTVSNNSRYWIVDEARMWKNRDGDAKEESIVNYFQRKGFEIGWHPRKMEVMKGLGFFGRERGQLGPLQFKDHNIE